jgi:hypothetical protein
MFFHIVMFVYQRVGELGEVECLADLALWHWMKSWEAVGFC